MKKKNKHKIFVETIGKPEFPRYRIVDKQRGYWNGNGWQKDKGTLYYWFEDATSTLKNIQTLENLGKPVKKFTATVTVELIGGEPVDKEELMWYLAHEARLLLANPSPKNSTVQVQIDWSTLKEEKGGHSNANLTNGGTN